MDSLSSLGAVAENRPFRTGRKPHVNALAGVCVASDFPRIFQKSMQLVEFGVSAIDKRGQKIVGEFLDFCDRSFECKVALVLKGNFYQFISGFHLFFPFVWLFG